MENKHAQGGKPAPPPAPPRHAPTELAVIGIQLRDWFASQALKGAADAICDQLEQQDEAGAREHAARHARAAYIMADAMLFARVDGTL